MPEEFDDIDKKKKSLIIALMRQKFEDNVFKYIESGKYSSMDELDETVDKMLRKFYEEREMVSEYYDKKIYG